MGDIEEIASLLIGKAEQYGALFNSRVFPLFVQRQMMWGYINLGAAILCLILMGVSVYLIHRGCTTKPKVCHPNTASEVENTDERDTYLGAGFSSLAFFVLLFASTAVTAIMKLGSPEYSAIMALVYLLQHGK